jgi:hypothetical protein
VRWYNRARLGQQLSKFFHPNKIPRACDEPSTYDAKEVIYLLIVFKAMGRRLQSQRPKDHLDRNLAKVDTGRACGEQEMEKKL